MIAEKFPNLGRCLDTQDHETNRSFYYLNAKTSSLRHLIMKPSKIKNKERILNATRKKKYKDCNPHRNLH